MADSTGNRTLCCPVWCIIMLTVLYVEDITQWCEDVNFIFEWQNNILLTSAASK